MTLPDNFRIGAHPDDIILALQRATKRFKKRLRNAAEHDPEWRRAFDQYRYRTGRKLSGWQYRKLREGRK